MAFARGLQTPQSLTFLIEKLCDAHGRSLVLQQREQVNCPHVKPKCLNTKTPRGRSICASCFDARPARHFAYLCERMQQFCARTRMMLSETGHVAPVNATACEQQVIAFAPRHAKEFQLTVVRRRTGRRFRYGI